MNISEKDNPPCSPSHPIHLLLFISTDFSAEVGKERWNGKINCADPSRLFAFREKKSGKN